jgi:hypothetical protein
MSERAAIARAKALPVAQDYAALRAEGLAHVQRLSGKLWTDHNLHDPGITTLEILCYALTDLAYRASFETRDLMTGPDGRIGPPSLTGLAPAHEALTTAPRTIADYRRLLLRIEGVRNAWLDAMTAPGARRAEVPIYGDCLADALSFQPLNTAGQSNHPVMVSGLYKVLVELDVDPLLGPLNDSVLMYQIRRGTLKGVIVAFDCADPAFVAGGVDVSRDIASIDALTVSTAPGGFTARFDLTLSGGTSVVLDGCTVVVIEDRPRPDRDAVAVTPQRIRPVLQASAADDLLPMFWGKQQRRARTLEKAACALAAHRGLCEDFLSIAAVPPYRIGLCADIEVRPDADLEAVQAAVFHEIEKYMSPPVRYRTLDDMLVDGRQPDEIFNGPFVDFGLTCAGDPVFTKPGFITDEDLVASELRRKVLASDLVNLIVDAPGVEAISNVLLRAFDKSGVPQGGSEKWVMDVPEGAQPVFFADGSKLVFKRAGIPYRAQVTEFQRTLDHLRALDRRRLYVPPDQVLPVPVGRWRHLDAFQSTQDDFPATYKIGRARISPVETGERIAQARQLKGYLAFFDQLLADYLTQLANVRHIYSLDRELTQTWFSSALKNVAGSLGQSFETEFYVDGAPPDDLVMTRLTESEEDFLERRNRVLDHLIARFAERFADYALLSFKLSGDRLKSSDGIIADKIAFLAEYPRLSRERGQAANLRPGIAADIWDSGNISGLERRVGRLLGFKSLNRRDRHCAGHFDALFGTQKAGSKFRVVVRDSDSKILFASKETFANERKALDAAAVVYPSMRDEGAFVIEQTQGATTWTTRLQGGGRVLTHNKTFDAELEATVAARAVINRYNEILRTDICDSEGMHLIEHLLLRPRSTDDPLMRVCLADDCGFCGEEDPYSFRVSVVLPYWPERFRSPHFRALFERTIREEAPAHVQVKVCWIGQRQMTELDAAYRAWLTAWAAARPVPLSVRTATKTLIDVLERLTTVYPAAFLHDCDVNETDAPARLGSTALGIF